VRAVARLAASSPSGFARFGAHVIGGLPLPESTDPALEELAVAGASGAISSRTSMPSLPPLGLAPAAAEALARADRPADLRR